MKKIAIIFLLPIITYGQTNINHNYKQTIDYYPDGSIHRIIRTHNSIIVDTLRVFNKKGGIINEQYYGDATFPRIISIKQTYKSGASRSMTGYYYQPNDTTGIKHGTWKYYWKNSSIMDSIIYDMGNQIYRARFNKKGGLQFVKNKTERIVYNKDGSIRLKEKVNK